MVLIAPFLYSKCLGCVYVQRESKSSDFKGVSGRMLIIFQETEYFAHYENITCVELDFLSYLLASESFLLNKQGGKMIYRIFSTPKLLCASISLVTKISCKLLYIFVLPSEPLNFSFLCSQVLLMKESGKLIRISLPH